MAGAEQVGTHLEAKESEVERKQDDRFSLLITK